MCAAAAGSVLTSFGIATIGIEPWFMPVVVVLLLIGLWGFWQSWRAHRQILPLLVAIVSSGAVIAGRLLESPLLLWVSTGGLMVAFALDAWIKRRKL